MIHLSMQETVSEQKVLGLLQYLCKSSPKLLTAIVSKMADVTVTAGQELLRFSAHFSYCVCECVY